MKNLALVLLLFFASCTSAAFYEDHITVSDLGKQCLRQHGASSPISLTVIAAEVSVGNTFAAALASAAPGVRTQVLPVRRVLDGAGPTMHVGHTRADLYQALKKSDWLTPISASNNAYLVAERPQLVVTVRLGRYAEDGEDRLLVRAQAIVFAPPRKGQPYEHAFDYEAQLAPGQFCLFWARNITTALPDAAAAFAAQLAPLLNSGLRRP